MAITTSHHPLSPRGTSVLEDIVLSSKKGVPYPLPGVLQLQAPQFPWEKRNCGSISRSYTIAISWLTSLSGSPFQEDHVELYFFNESTAVAIMCSFCLGKRKTWWPDLFNRAFDDLSVVVLFGLPLLKSLWIIYICFIIFCLYCSPPCEGCSSESNPKQDFSQVCSTQVYSRGLLLCF